MIDGFRKERNDTELPKSDTEPTSPLAAGSRANVDFLPQEDPSMGKNEQASQTNGTPSAQPPQKHSIKQWWAKLNGKQKALVTGGAALLAGGIIIGAYFLFFTNAPKPVATAPKPHKQQVRTVPKPTTVASSLSGLQVDPSVNERPVTGIMIENSQTARPQSGLNQASVVFEAVAEGGITRFLTLFQDTEPDYIGPVRSVRPYYIQWALGFDAAIAHAGGSKEGLNDMKAWNVKDLNDATGYFTRITDRAAPHNLYTSIAKLHEYEAKKGYGKASFTPLTRKVESPSKVPTAKTIDFNLSSADFAAHYDYDATTNSYKRSEGGAPHTDQRSGAQLSPKVVVALIMPQGKNDIYTTYQTIGNGTAYVFQDGTVTVATWRKDSNTAQFTFVDQNGQTLGLNPGQTWFTALGDTSRVTYAP